MNRMRNNKIIKLKCGNSLYLFTVRINIRRKCGRMFLLLSKKKCLLWVPKPILKCSYSLLENSNKTNSLSTWLIITTSATINKGGVSLKVKESAELYQEVALKRIISSTTNTSPPYPTYSHNSTTHVLLIIISRWVSTK